MTAFTLITQPLLQTERLNLRPFELTDAKRVQELAGHPKIAATTVAIPHPYLDGMAEAWIKQHQNELAQGTAIKYAITLKNTGVLIGCIDFLGISKSHHKAEIGYWVGVDYWGNGYCTEAVKALIKYGFKYLGFNKIIARHMVMNPASGRVMLKAGMQKEGTLRKELLKNGQFQDIDLYGILQEEFID